MLHAVTCKIQHHLWRGYWRSWSTDLWSAAVWEFCSCCLLSEWKRNEDLLTIWCGSFLPNLLSLWIARVKQSVGLITGLLAVDICRLLQLAWTLLICSSTHIFFSYVKDLCLAHQAPFPQVAWWISPFPSSMSPSLRGDHKERPNTYLWFLASLCVIFQTMNRWPTLPLPLGKIIINPNGELEY